MSLRLTFLTMVTTTCLVVALLVCESLGQTRVTEHTLSREQGSPSPPATVADFGWIAGHWAGNAMGGTFEETWNGPKGDSMIGVFKFLKDDKVEFCELLTIVATGDSVVLRLKHFDARLRGWEAKDDAVEFPLVKVTDHEAYFEGLTFRRTGANRLTIYVVFHEKGKPDHEVEFAAELVSSSGLDRRAPMPTANVARASADRLLAVDAALSDLRNRMTESMPLDEAVATYVEALRRADWSGVPVELADALKRHLAAWEASMPFLEEHASLRGEMHALFDQIRAIDEQQKARLNTHFEKIMESWEAIEQASSQIK